MLLRPSDGSEWPFAGLLHDRAGQHQVARTTWQPSFSGNSQHANPLRHDAGVPIRHSLTYSLNDASHAASGASLLQSARRRMRLGNAARGPLRDRVGVVVRCAERVMSREQMGARMFPRLQGCSALYHQHRLRWLTPAGAYSNGACGDRELTAREFNS